MLMFGRNQCNNVSKYPSIKNKLKKKKESKGIKEENLDKNDRDIAISIRLQSLTFLKS